MKIHIDLDAFFAAAERTVRPELLGKPIAVGGRGDQHIFDKQHSHQHISLENSGAFVPSIMMDSDESTPQNIEYFTDPDGRIRGILTTASYEARKRGIKTPMPIAEALRICPDLIVLKPTFGLYHRLSMQLREFLEERIPVLEQFSIDEFFGDLEGWIDEREVGLFIDNIKQEVMDRFALPCSIGAAHSKWTAKVATSYAKPFGTKIVWPDEVIGFVSPMPIEKFPGIGYKLSKRFHAMGFVTLGDIVSAKAYFMKQVPSMQELYRRVCGIDSDKVHPPKQRKSIGVSRTFDPIVDREEMKRRIMILCRHLSFTVRKYDFTPTQFGMYIRYEFSARAKGSVKSNRLFSEKRFINDMVALFERIDSYPTFYIRSISITTGSFIHQTRKGTSLISYEEDKKIEIFDKKLHLVRQKYGLDVLKWGSEMRDNRAYKL